MKHGKQTEKTADGSKVAQEPAAEGSPVPRPEETLPEPPMVQVVREPPELDVVKDRLLRLQADFDNFRKRTQRERAELYTRANEDLIVELLTILDHFERGLAMSLEHKTESAVHDGFRIVYDQLLNVLKKFGVSPLDAHEAAFDPHLHEAVSHVPSDEYGADQIVAQLRRGYKLGDRLLRPVQVVVSSGPGAPRDDGEKAEPERPAQG
jgi:molecular chaperone GrpE